MGITRNVGKIFLDRQGGNYDDYRRIRERIGFIFQVSRAATRLRFRELNIVYEPAHADESESEGPQPLSNFLVDVVKHLERSSSEASDGDALPEVPDVGE